MAQLILEKIVNPDTELVNSLPDTSRRASGFGSTGISHPTKSNPASPSSALSPTPISGPAAATMINPAVNPAVNSDTPASASASHSRGYPTPAARSADLGCNEPMVVPAILQSGSTSASSAAMIDSGASTQFLDLDFAVKNNLPLDLKPRPETLIVVDGREATAPLTHTCTLNLMID